MIRRYGDLLAGIVFLALTAVYYRGTFINLKFKLSQYGAEFVPRIYCVVMALVAVALVIRGIRQARSPHSRDTVPIQVDWAAVGKVALSIGLIGLYTAMLRPVGFVLSTFLYLALQVAITAPRKKFRPFSVFLFAAGISCSLNYLFLHVFHLVLPAGVLSF